jgi:DNA-binding NarL/FixJ family response regulator
MARKSHFVVLPAFDLESLRGGFHGAVMKRMEKSLSKISLMVVDDHAMVRMGLKAMLALEPDFEVIAEAEDAAEAVTRYRECLPDVMLLDLRMPGDSGVVVVRRILGEFPAARIIMLTSFDLEEEVFQSLDAGAQGYVLKSVERGELNRTIRRVYGGERCVPPAIEKRLAERALSEPLSAREIEVLDHMRRGHSNRDIAGALGISEHTAKNHTRAILRKLRVADRAEAVAAGFERGLLHAGS